MIQGPPGAGKTALLHQCAVEADIDGWHVAKINNQALYEPAVMAQNLGEPYITRKERVTTLDAKVVARATTTEMAGAAAVPQVLKALTPDTGLLLLLDEAQTIGALTGRTYGPSVTTTLNAIHNGDLGRPVILLCGGLGISKSTFGALGISRSDIGCMVNLGRLSEAAERAVIQDWLRKDGRAKGDVIPWTHAIASETHGWPQHIMCFAQPAAWVVRHNGGELTPGRLAYVMERGHQGKTEYYQGRIDDVEKIIRSAIGKLLGSRPADRELDKHVILAALSGGRTPNEAQAEFDTLLHKGVIALTPEGSYAVPIPSMRDWLVERYGREDQLRWEDPGLDR